MSYVLMKTAHNPFRILLEPETLFIILLLHIKHACIHISLNYILLFTFTLFIHFQLFLFGYNFDMP